MSHQCLDKSVRLFIVNLFMPCKNLIGFNYRFLQNYLAASAGAAVGAAGAAGAGAASAGAAAGAATGSTLTSSFLPHATRARVTKPKAITFFILFS
jgi:type IV secretory pathway TrbL component